MEKKLFLSLRTRSTSTKKPIYELSVDGELQTAPQRVSVLDQYQETHEFALTRSELSCIEIRLLNKSPDDTKLGPDGNITEDLLLVIDQFMIDHIDFTNKLDKISIYQDTQGQVHRTFNHITFNGSYRIKLHRNPLYTEWLASYL